MKNVFTRINNVRLQTSQNNGQLSNLFFSLKDRVKVFSEKENKNTLENIFHFEKEFIIDDEILNFHVFGEFLLLIGRNSKKLFLYNQSGDKLKE
jgi:hypothetical protein